MARARNIKPGFFRNEILAELEPLTRILFAGLWTIADRAGRLEDRPKRIKADVLPYDDCNIDEMLDALAESGFVARYKYGAAQYIQIIHFTNHQNPHKNEAESVIPPMTADGDSPPSAKLDTPSDAPKTPAKSRVREKYGTSTVQVPDKHTTNRADSLNTDSLSLEGTDVPDAAASSPDKPFALLEALCEVQGHDVSILGKRDKDKQLGVAKRLVDNGLSAADVSRMTKWLLGQSWITGGIDLFLVEKQAGKWRLAGKPDMASQSNTTTHQPENPFDVIERELQGTPPENVIDARFRRTS